MGDAKSINDDEARSQDDKAQYAPERKLRGGALKGSEQKSAADHTEYEEERNPDTELRLDDETDTLYKDGLDIEDDPSATPAGTRGGSFGIKP
ncbi:MAG TPA: hypothetical protein VHY75_01265 [Steroidobacteraceae bacterium]|jgi:hypothetical protein|nr:hypothetical protein [Steroidobacteraceae bacterium]